MNNVISIRRGNFELLHLTNQSFDFIGGELIGIDPVPKEEIPHSITFINDYFQPKTYNFTLSLNPNVYFFENVLEHIPDLRNFLSGLQMIFRADDHLYICVPSFETMINESLLEEISHEHAHYFSRKDLNRLLSEFGFNSISCLSKKVISRSYNFHLFTGGTFKVTR